MYFKLSNIFKRDTLTSVKEIIKWWMKGIVLLNLFYLIYAILHYIILSQVFVSVWTTFITEIIIAIWLFINILYFSGLFAELILSKIFKAKINFDKISPKIKEWIILFSVIIVVLSSVYHIVNH